MAIGTGLGGPGGAAIGRGIGAAIGGLSFAAGNTFIGAAEYGA